MSKGTVVAAATCTDCPKFAGLATATAGIVEAVELIIGIIVVVIIVVVVVSIIVMSTASTAIVSVIAARHCVYGMRM